jgi:hypothetical protein
MTVFQAIEPDGDPIAAVASWRARGAADADPVGFCITEGLARRAAGLQGPARGLLCQRIGLRLAAHAQTMARLPPGGSPANPAVAGLAALGNLVDRLNRTQSSPESARPGPGHAQRPGAPAPTSPLRAVTLYKRTWSRLRAEQRLRQALAQVPSMAGPLNSSQVVHRALQAMHDLSPDYLEAFMAHIDTLLWLEQASGADLLSRGPRAPANRPRGAARATPGLIKETP